MGVAEARRQFPAAGARVAGCGRQGFVQRLQQLRVFTEHVQAR
jgi:hypothetical protein